jgi:hypothetical protein
VRGYRQYIGGEWIESAELFDDLDPYRIGATCRSAR